MRLTDVEGWLTTALQSLIAPPWLAVGLGAFVLAALLAGLVVAKRSRRARRAREAALARKVDQEAQSLLIELRQRLWEPPQLFDDHLNGAPTMGAREGFEGDIRRAAGSILREAGGERRKAREILRQRLLQGQGHRTAKNGESDGDAAGNWRQLGALSLVDGSRDAVTAYSRAVDLAPRCAEGHMLLGVLQLRGGHVDAAEQSFLRQIALADAPETVAVRYRGRTMLGDVYAARHETDGALATYREAQAEIEGLRAERPHEDQLGLSRDLSVTLDRIGDCLYEKGEHAAALASYAQGLTIAEELARAEGHHHLDLYHDLSVSHERIADVLDKRGDLLGAHRHFKKSLAISKALVKREPDNRMWVWDLSTSYERLADALHALGRREEALRMYRKGLEIGERLVVGSGLSEAPFQRDLAVSYHKIGSLEAMRGNGAEARELLEKGRAIIAQLDRIAAHQAQWRSDLSKFDAALKSVH